MKHVAIAVLVVALLGCAAVASAQTPVTPGNKIAWDQSAPTLAEAQGYTYKYYPDAATVGVTFTLVTCTGTASPFQCEVAFPAFTPGSHTLAITASNTAGESVKSMPLSFTFVVIPSAPTGLRIK